jgi:hypothetical protein
LKRFFQEILSYTRHDRFGAKARAYST